MRGPIPSVRFRWIGAPCGVYDRAKQGETFSMSASAGTWDAVAPADETSTTDGPVERTLTPSARTFFVAWTAAWWGGVGVCAVLFFTGVLDYLVSTKLSLYGISIWLNGWMIPWFMRRNEGGSKLQLYHDCLVIWMLSYMLTNVLWEIPWVVFSPILFVDMHSIDQVLAQTGYMRESILHMYYWVISSFSSVDLRTINRDPTFYSVEIFSFVNVASVLYFLHLNKKRSPYRYVVAVLGCGEPVAATFIFSFAEVFGGFENMTGGFADTLLALVWTQYQYFFFPLVFGAFGIVLLRDDWRRSRLGEDEPVR